MNNLQNWNKDIDGFVSEYKDYKNRRQNQFEVNCYNLN